MRKAESILAFALRRLKCTGTTVAFVAMTTVIVSVMGILTPAFSRVLLDRLLTGQNPDWVTPFFLCFSAITLLQIAVELIRDANLLKLNGKMAAAGSTGYLWHVLHLPMSFFSQRLAGDIQRRQQDNAQIAERAVNTLVPLVLNAVMMLVYLFVMFRFSPLLACVGVSAVLVNVLLARVISRKRINITRVRMQNGAQLGAVTASGIGMMETIKASGAEDGFFRHWAGLEAATNAQDVKYTRLDNFLGGIPALLSSLTSVIVLSLGVLLTMDGKFTVGMILAFQSFLTAFMTPAEQMISAGQELQEMRTSMERVEDVMEYPTDDHFAPEEAERDDSSYSKLTGSIELSHVSFRYEDTGPLIIDDLSLKITPGQYIAIVGKTGCGKSTLLRLLLGFETPQKGAIYYDGMDLTTIDLRSLRRSIGTVMQNGSLFQGDLYSNITITGCPPSNTATAYWYWTTGRSSRTAATTSLSLPTASSPIWWSGSG